ncbi:hypothetical protein AF72_05860 [Xylella taiwanensis]|uniref:Uncharacterized protein n=1 Tax=Xylella taiwanensis TaxID=1444770 RepID=Z9JL21_9GAMM|nr:hypothetical protein AB672_03100 [Xylella taiwanensis]EWS78506.1 hypothetical protein AF72_05860 [Xylella taiwanensis]
MPHSNFIESEWPHVPINLGDIRRTERTHLNMHWHAHTVFKLQRRLNRLSSNTSLTKRHQHHMGAARPQYHLTVWRHLQALVEHAHVEHPI